jgi:hypothetical protein
MLHFCVVRLHPEICSRGRNYGDRVLIRQQNENKLDKLDRVKQEWHFCSDNVTGSCLKRCGHVRWRRKKKCDVILSPY